MKKNKTIRRRKPKTYAKGAKYCNHCGGALKHYMDEVSCLMCGRYADHHCDNCSKAA